MGVGLLLKIMVLTSKHGVYASNPVPEGKMRFLEGIPQTTKKDKKNHGIGMQSIQRVVESYGGHVQIDVKEEVFELVIYMEGF